jgi:foldase protein PrsA
VAKANRTWVSLRRRKKTLSNPNKGTATILAVIVTLAVAGTGGYMLGNRTGQNSANLNTQVVATVNNDKISKNDLYDRMAQQSGAQAVKDMIDEKLVNQAAAAAKVEITDKQIDAEINKIKANLGGEEQFQQALQSNGITLPQLRDYQRMRLAATAILSKDIPQDDATLQKYFEENKAQFDKREVHARHILVTDEAQAKSIKEQLDKGGDFAALAKANSTDPGSKDQGGDLGFFGLGKMDPDFEKVAFSLKPNEISAPVKTQFGYHIIQLLESRGTAPDFNAQKADVKDAYMAEQVGQKMQPWLDDLRSKAKITNTLEPKTPAPASK